MSDWQKRQRGAFWKKEGKNGKKYLSGYVTIDGKQHPVTVFPNEYKEKDNQPSFLIYETTNNQ